MFTRENYNNLRHEFPDINKRLKEGLKKYKITQSARIIKTLKQKMLSMLDDEEVAIEEDIYITPSNLFFIFLLINA